VPDYLEYSLLVTSQTVIMASLLLQILYEHIEEAPHQLQRTPQPWLLLKPLSGGLDVTLKAQSNNPLT
jgi:hypothetical protein